MIDKSKLAFLNYLKAALEQITIEDEFGCWNTETKKHEPVTRKPFVFIQDGTVYMSAEDGGYFANYYGKYDNGGDAWVHASVIDVARRNGYTIEWRDPGSIGFYK